MFGLFRKTIKASVLSSSNIDKIIQNQQFAILMFGAGWCGACKMQKPIMNTMAEHHKDSDVVIGLVDTDREPSLSQLFGITALPTIVVLQGQELLFKKAGLMSRRDLEKIVTQLQKIPV